MLSIALRSFLMFIIRRRGLCVGFENHRRTCFHRVEARCPVHSTSCLRIVVHFGFGEALRTSLADALRCMAAPIESSTSILLTKQFVPVRSRTVPCPTPGWAYPCFLRSRPKFQTVIFDMDPFGDNTNILTKFQPVMLKLSR